MEGIMLTVDRLIDGLNGEDPGSARIYMAQIREEEAESLLQCFQELIAGILSSPSSVPLAVGDGGGVPLNGSSDASLAYRVPPSEFLKVLLEGSATRLRALHIVLQAMGSGDLQGRAASRCLSEVRMCLAACTGPADHAVTPDLNFYPIQTSTWPVAVDAFTTTPGSSRNGATGSTPPHQQRRSLRVRQLRELVGVCLAFVIHPTPTTTGGQDTSVDTNHASDSNRRHVRGGQGPAGRVNAGNGRMLMLDVLPALLGACCASAAEEERVSDDDSDDDDRFDSLHDGRLEVFASPDASVVRGSMGTGDSNLKGKGKTPTTEDYGLGGVGVCARQEKRRSRPQSTATSMVTAVATRRRADDTLLPRRGQQILLDVTGALLNIPWAPELALPLLGMFEGISDILEALDECYIYAHDGAGYDLERERGWGGGQAGGGYGVQEMGIGGEGVWAMVRSRLMECVWMGGLDGADFTGVVRQVCVLCENDCRRTLERNRQPLSSCRQGDVRRDHLHVSLAAKDGEVGERHVRNGPDGCYWRQQEGQLANAQQISVASSSRDWLSCLCRLYAAVPPEWLATVELVLEQTLHQMPDVADSLLDTIRQRSESDSIAGGRQGGAGSRRICNTKTTDNNSLPLVRTGLVNGRGNGIGQVAEGSTSHDFALLLLLLREASPLRACYLPLLPEWVDRGRRAEDAVRVLLLSAAYRGLEGRGGGGGSGGRHDTECGCERVLDDGPDVVAGRGRAVALASVRTLVKSVLCNDAGSGRRGSGSFVGGTGSSTAGFGSSAGGGCGGEVESSSVASERASQLLELALRWLEGGKGGGGGSAVGDFALGADALAPEIISVVFDAVPRARPRLLRSLMSGVIDRSSGGATCARSYLSAWELLMAQEAALQCRRMAPHSQVVSDVLGQLILLPPGRARRVVESILPLADTCPSHASALISLCRKCSGQAGSKGRLLVLHAVTCILAWNARRDVPGRRKGCLNQGGVQEDLIGMFRRAMEGGLQTATRANALHFLASKVRTNSSSTWHRSTSFTNKGEAVALAGSEHGAALAQPEPAATIDLKALSGLRQLLADRLFRFFPHNDEVIVGSIGGGDSGSANSMKNVDGANHHRHRPYAGGDHYRYTSHGGAEGIRMHADGGKDRVNRKGKGKKRACAAQQGRYQFAALRLLETRRPPKALMSVHGGGGRSRDGSLGSGDGVGNVAGVCSMSSKGYGGAESRIPRSDAEVVPRDAIGQLIKCCWALVPDEIVPFDGGGSQSTLGGEAVVVGVRDGDVVGKRAEAEAVARAILGLELKSSRVEREQGVASGAFVGDGRVCTREGEALLAVVEFLAGGACMETVRVATTSQQVVSENSGDGGIGFDDRDTRDPHPPPSCHPGLVGPLPTLAVVVTLAEAVVDCLLDAVLSRPAVAYPSPPPESNITKSGGLRIGVVESCTDNMSTCTARAPTPVSAASEASRRKSHNPQHPMLLFWAAADSFTLLAAAARAAEGLAEATGAMKQSGLRQDLSAVIASLPGETLGFSSLRGQRSQAECEEDERGNGTGRTRSAGGEQAVGGISGRRNGSQARPGLSPLLSATSALTFVNEFLHWSARPDVEREKRRKMALREGKCSGEMDVTEAVSEGWDGGIGVWLGLTHSIRILARSLESSARSCGQCGAESGVWCEGGGSGSRDVAFFPVHGKVAADDSPSGEDVALAIFRLRRVVGSPAAAAGIVHGRGVSPSADGAPCTPEYRPDGTRAAVHENVEDRVDGLRAEDALFSRRPPPGTMLTGFLKHMNGRWKVHIDWGLPGLAPPRRASPRLERSNRIRRRGFYDDHGEDEGSSRGHFRNTRGNNPEGVREEADDLFCALRRELLRAERLAFSVFLVGGTSTKASRRWVVRAALSASASFRSGDGDRSREHLQSKRGDSSGAGPSSVCVCSGAHDGATEENDDSPSLSNRCRRTGRGGINAGEEPEAGSGPARSGVLAAANTDVRWPLRSRTQRSAISGGREGVTRIERGGMASPELQRGMGDEHSSRGKKDSPTKVSRRIACTCRTLNSSGRKELEVGEGLGRLCLYAAMEMREGLENGLSVKLTQAYLDLVELLGNEAVKHRQCTPQDTSRIGPVDDDLTACGNGEAIKNNEDGNPDAGEILLSVLTCHCITQVSLFQRLVRGALKFEGVGVPNRLRRHRCSRQPVQILQKAAPTAIDALTLTVSPNAIERQQQTYDDGLPLAGMDHSVGVLHQQSTPDDRGTIDESAGAGWNNGTGAERGGLSIARAEALLTQFRLIACQDRCSRFLVHCAIWIRRRQVLGGSGEDNTRRRVDDLAAEDIEQQSNEEPVVATSCGGAGNSRPAVTHVSDGEDGNDDDSDEGKYDVRPEAVIMASPRECYAALARILVEYETALLSSVACFGAPGPGQGCGDGDVSIGGVVASLNGHDVGEVLAAIAGGLRELFETKAQLSTPAVVELEKAEDGVSTASGPWCSPNKALSTTKKASSSDVLAQNQARRVPQRDTTAARKVGESNTSGGNGKPRAVVDVLPEVIKLRLFVLLGRVYHVGRAVALVASRALAKPLPPCPGPRTRSAASAKAAQNASFLSIASLPPPPPSSAVSVQSPLQRHRPHDDDGKPGDKAAGVGSAKMQASTGRVSPRSASSTGSTITLPLPSPAPVAMDTCEKTPKGDREGLGVPLGPLRDRLFYDVKVDASPSSTADLVRVNVGLEGLKDGTEEVQVEAAGRLLAAVLPAVVAASGDRLKLMLAARAWAEAERCTTRRAGNDSCRKTASTLLFKIDRCEIELGKAAHEAQQYLARLDADSGGNDASNPVNGVDNKSKRINVARGGGTAVGGPGPQSRIAHLRPCGNVGGDKGSRIKGRERRNHGSCREKLGGGASSNKNLINACDMRLEQALRALVSGADILASSRRDSVVGGSRGGSCGRIDRNTRDGRRCFSRIKQVPRQGQGQEDGDDHCRLAVGSGSDDDSRSVEGSEMEEGEESEGDGDRADKRAAACGRVGFGAVLLSGRKRSRSKHTGGARLRSRNTVIDGWLGEGGAEGGEGADAFVDLEDFIVG